MIPFNKPYLSGKELHFIGQVLENLKFTGDGPFNQKCCQYLQNLIQSRQILLTPSCTASLEFAALLIDIKKDDEVICPSYTFPTSVSAFSNFGAKIKFVDIEKDTFNLDFNQIEKVITKKTKAIIAVHYAGVSCDMEKIMNLAEKHNLYVIEDSAQGLLSQNNKGFLGTIGHIGCFSFHETKNINSGEGGAISINDERLFRKAEIIQEKGTNRKEFIKGEVDKYSWVAAGSSYLMNEVTAAFLFAQLQNARIVTDKRVLLWNKYYTQLKSLQDKGKIGLTTIPKYAKSINGHIFYLICNSQSEREDLRKYLANKKIGTTSHYVPLHSSLHGKTIGEFVGSDNFTTSLSQKILRLPMYFDLKESEVELITSSIFEYYK